MVSTAGSNSRCLSSFTGRAEHQKKKINHLWVCVAETVLPTLFMDIMIIIIILISSSVGDISKLPGDGDFFLLVLV